MTNNQRLLETNITALQEGAQLLMVLEVNQYTEGYKPAFHSTIGAHFRHVLEHYRCFIAQLDSRLFCYDKRERDQLLECDADYAARTIDELKAALLAIDDSHFEAAYLIDDQQTAEPVSTTLQRELLFLQSHTVHHYAIIGAMTRAFGNKPKDDFGVAIATREHQKATATENHTGDTSPCAQ